MMRRDVLILTLVFAVGAALGPCSKPSLASTKHQGPKQKIFAQQLVEQAISKYPVVTQLELAVRSSGRCLIIAASDPKGIGEKCDQDELEAMRTGEPFVEKENDVFDVTMPLHDMTDKIIGTVGMDFKPEPGQQRSTIVGQAKKIEQELSSQISTIAKLYEPVD